METTQSLLIDPVAIALSTFAIPSEYRTVRRLEVPTPSVDTTASEPASASRSAGWVEHVCLSGDEIFVAQRDGLGPACDCGHPVSAVQALFHHLHPRPSRRSDDRNPHQLLQRVGTLSASSVLTR